MTESKNEASRNLEKALQASERAKQRVANEKLHFNMVQICLYLYVILACVLMRATSTVNGVNSNADNYGLVFAGKI